jgi:hypothetical protein
VEGASRPHSLVRREQHRIGTIRMSDEQLREIVKARICVTHQNVAIAKGLLLKHFQTDADSMIGSALRDLGLTRPDSIVIEGEEDSTTDVQRLGDYFSWSLCIAEALWSLIHAGALIPSSWTSMICIGTTIRIARVGGGGTSGRKHTTRARERVRLLPAGESRETPHSQGGTRASPLETRP